MTATMILSADAQALRFSLDPFERGEPGRSPPWSPLLNVSHYSSDPHDLARFASGFSFEDEDESDEDDAKK
jgi:hypothetical protein